MNVEPYLGFAKNVTKQLYGRWRRCGASFDDMLSGAYLGLMTAAAEYEQQQPAFAFEQWAYTRIYDEVRTVTTQEWRSRGVIDTTVGGREGQRHVRAQRLALVPWPIVRPEDGPAAPYDPPDARSGVPALEWRDQMKMLFRLPLTARERETLRGVLRGHTDATIAHQAGVAPQSINATRARIIRKARRRLAPARDVAAVGVGLLAGHAHPPVMQTGEQVGDQRHRAQSATGSGALIVRQTNDYADVRRAV